MSTIQIADKTTLDNTKTNTTNLLAKGGIKYNATSQKYQTYNTTNSSWVDTEFGGGSASPTLIIKNEDNRFTNVSFTVSNTDYDYSETKNMGSNTYLIFEVPMLGEYTVSWNTKSKIVNVNTIGGVQLETLKIVSFSAGTDKQISDMLEAYYNDEITWAEMGWAVGDTRVIHLDSMQAPNPNSSDTWAAQDITVVIVDHDHTNLATPINEHTKACITVQTRECMNNNTTAYNAPGHIYVNGDSSYDTTFTKWSNLYMRTYINDKVWGAFPSTFKAAIKPSTHYRHTTYNGSGSEQVTDNLFLPSYPEIYGTESSSYYAPTNPVEGTQFAYYQITSNRIKYGNNNGVSNDVVQEWFQGSTSSYYSSNYRYGWCRVSTDGSANASAGSVTDGLAPAFAM